MTSRFKVSPLNCQNLNVFKKIAKLLRCLSVIFLISAGKGNIALSAEFNFNFDPEAAYIVLKDLKSPIRILPWETCLTDGIPWVRELVISISIVKIVLYKLGQMVLKSSFSKIELCYIL